MNWNKIMFKNYFIYEFGIHLGDGFCSRILFDSSHGQLAILALNFLKDICEHLE
jgi:hypothetical protein